MNHFLKYNDYSTEILTAIVDDPELIINLRHITHESMIVLLNKFLGPNFNGQIRDFDGMDPKTLVWSSTRFIEFESEQDKIKFLLMMSG